MTIDGKVRKCRVGDGTEADQTKVNHELIETVKGIDPDKIVCALGVFVVRSETDPDGVEVNAFFTATHAQDLAVMAKILQETISTHNSAVAPPGPQEVRH
jgi:hypothetical protein